MSALRAPAVIAVAGLNGIAMAFFNIASGSVWFGVWDGILGGLAVGLAAGIALQVALDRIVQRRR